jgi:hypothetical protein
MNIIIIVSTTIVMIITIIAIFTIFIIIIVNNNSAARPTTPSLPPSIHPSKKQTKQRKEAGTCFYAFLELSQSFTLIFIGPAGSNPCSNHKDRMHDADKYVNVDDHNNKHGSNKSPNDAMVCGKPATG